jgi:hypothetical protein
MKTVMISTNSASPPSCDLTIVMTAASAAPHRHQLLGVLLEPRRQLLGSLGLSGGLNRSGSLNLSNPYLPCRKLVDAPARRLWRR